MPQSIAVFGAGPALGRAVARRYAREGYTVTLVARRPEPLERMTAELIRTGATAHAVAGGLYIGATIEHSAFHTRVEADAAAGRPTRVDPEYEYLTGHPLGRLATIGPDGAPQIHPVAFRVNADTGTIDIGGPALSRSQKYRNIQADPRVSFVVDDQAESPNPIGQTGRGVELRGRAEIAAPGPPGQAAFSPETIRVHPHRIIAWNIGELPAAAAGRPPHLQGYRARDVARRP
jgi:pyridoxamine 5'-phosphate oxidase family protein